MADAEPTPEQVKEQKLYREWGLTDAEYDLIADKILGRLPNYTEAGLYSVMWSEHCSYKHSKQFLRGFPTDGEHVLQGPGEGAGIVDIGGGLAIAFKMESHNHPSAVEPYEGAATGVGGILRDVFSMGATPIASLNSLRFGELDDPRTKFLVREVIAGLAGYGNTIGVPTVGGEIAFDPVYQGNPLVNAMVVGLMKHEDTQKGLAAGAGNLIMYAGATTGRDGIHGATFASESFEDEGEEPVERSAVQAGDPFIERLLMDACLDLIQNHSDVLVGIQDMGAAGLVSSSSEMASKAGFGMKLNLDLVPTREEGMTPYEMMLSESQERMLICVKQGGEETVADVFANHGLEAVTIGEVTEDPSYQLFFGGELVTDIPVDSLAEAPEANPPVKKPARLLDPGDPWVPEVSDPTQVLLDLLGSPTIASKASLFQTFDSRAGGDTVVLPGSDAGVVRVRGTDKALAMTTDCNARYLFLDPNVGAQAAVAEAARNVVAAGGRPLAITDCLNFGSPENPESYWELQEATAGISAACNALGFPVISGNVSLYNEFDGQSIYPTPTIGMVGLIDHLDQVTPSAFKAEGDAVYVVGKTGSDFDGSELQKLLTGEIFGPFTGFDIDAEKAAHDLVLTAIRTGLVQSAHDVSEGGLAVAIAESLFSESDQNLGVSLATALPAGNLFSETQGRFVLSTRPENRDALQELAQQMGVTLTHLGEVTREPRLLFQAEGGSIDIPVAEAKQTYFTAIPNLLA